MSDLSLYELEDIIWEDFERSGDHIVPFPKDGHDSEDKCEVDSCKKPRREETPIWTNEERENNILNKDMNIMEEDSWSQIPDGVFAASGDAIADSAKDMPSHINKSDGDDKESNDLLYYGWPDIGNFDDVDKMLSNCDSSFGLGVTGNDDELVWFTSEDPAGGYDEALNTDLKFPCSTRIALTDVSQNHEPRGPDNTRSSFVSESKDEFKLKDQSNASLHRGPRNDHVPMQTTSGSMITCIKNESKVPTSEKQFHKSGKKIKSQSDMEEVNAKLGLLDVPEGSSVSYELDEMSLEATNFRQLQQVMEQLDLRTKLCIRDSLYRLATSAEQRHNFAGVSDSTANCGGIGGPLVTGRTNKYTSLMNMETDTNPIDRTIAHLLFHRPSDSSNRPTPSPLKPNAKIHGSANESDDKISGTRKN